MKKKEIKYTHVLLSAIFTLIMLIFAFFYNNAVTFSFVSAKLILPIARLMLFITVGLAVGQTIEGLGVTKKLSVIARPIFKFSNLGNRSATTFIAAFFSGVVANSMLVDFYKDNKIGKMQLFLTNYLNQLPAYFLHLPTTFFIVLPLTGMAGLIYFALTFSAVFIRFVIVLIFARFYFPSESTLEREGFQDGKKHEKANKVITMPDILKRLIPRMVSIFIWVIPIYTIVFVLNSYEMFDYLNDSISQTISSKILPVQSISVVVISFAAEFTAGFAAAGALMEQGAITIKQTVLALLLGNIIAFPIRALRHQIPRYLGIFSPKIGLSLLLTGQTFRITSLIVVALIYYAVG